MRSSCPPRICEQQLCNSVHLAWRQPEYGSLISPPCPPPPPKPMSPPGPAGCRGDGPAALRAGVRLGGPAAFSPGPASPEEEPHSAQTWGPRASTGISPSSCWLSRDISPASSPPPLGCVHLLLFLKTHLISLGREGPPRPDSQGRPPANLPFPQPEGGSPGGRGP